MTDLWNNLAECLYNEREALKAAIKRADKAKQHHRDVMGEIREACWGAIFADSERQEHEKRLDAIGVILTREGADDHPSNAS